MLNITQDLLREIETKINELDDEYSHVRGKILTEADLKCSIFMKLHEIPILAEPEEIAEGGILASKIHSELSWFNEKYQLQIRPDITILDPSSLKVFPFSQISRDSPSKGFEFMGDAIIFELKFNRKSTGIDEHYFKNQIKDDFDKIERLNERIDREIQEGAEGKIFCYFIIFNRTNITCQEFDDFIAQYGENERYKFIYKSGNEPID